ncbi:Na+/H+ antiporter NhaC [Pseudalkalibacillus berkeleyi]|uniref:Na+/H+ antiporter NhaC n=1 Tax=Pseudalkalibacillus berkeleyi TaxID=1069813 RepID=A0ABS9H1S9_9BACL|nr:Na+/H+ antiporter NhaC [Pseudalkalibacillus berkeleyi]MCF6137910.1 Na+/H+ antiporter NhaC [Pseudalkalibacillus berkeleyi]
MAAKKQQTFSLISFVLLIGIILYSMLILKTEPHIPLLISLVAIAILAKAFGYKWERMEKGLIDGISIGIKPVLILMIIGMLIGTWMMSGTVPTMLFYGTNVIDPSWFTLSALVLTIIVSTFTGSSFTTIGTVGVALMGLATSLGVHPGLAAGAIISGACFGDKMSPLSDTTNFAPAVAGVPLFSHIKHLMWTTVPALIITIFIFLMMGSGVNGDQALTSIQSVQTQLQSAFNISFWTLLSPLVVIGLAIVRFPTIPALIIGVITGVLTIWGVQGQGSISAIFNMLQNGFELETGEATVDKIINRGGIQSMMWSISLIWIALALGGLVRGLGMLDSFVNLMKNKIRSRGNTIATTAMSAIGVNVLTGEQYLSILIPGQTFKPHFEKQNIDPRNLSRTLEDAGTLVNPLIPWGVSGAFFASTLEISVLDYMPYVFFLFLSPLFTILFGYLGVGVGKKNKALENE